MLGLDAIAVTPGVAPRVRKSSWDICIRGERFVGHESRHPARAGILVRRPVGDRIFRALFTHLSAPQRWLT